jgi:hypothetical protein
MKLKYFKSSATIIYTITLITFLFLNVFLEIRPIADYINYLERSHLFFLIPLSVLIPIGLFLFDKVIYEKHMDEKVELFKTTIRILQDIVEDSNTKTQLLIHELKEADVDDKILSRANDIFEKSSSLFNSLYSLDALSTKIKDTSGILQIFGVNNKSE